MRLREKVLTILVVFMVFYCSILPAPAYCEFVDRTVATVNGELILYSDIQAQIKLMKQMIPDLKIDDPQQKAGIEREVLQQLIRQRLTEQEVKRLKIVVTKPEVDSTIEQMQRENKLTPAQFEAILKQGGQDLEKYREGIRKELERNRLLDRVLKNKTFITDQQVDAYLKGGGTDTAPAVSADASRSAGPRKVHLGVIYLPLDQKKGNAREVEKTGRDILDKIKGGADFGKMATQYSTGPGADEGGDIGTISPEDLAPQIASAIQGLQKEQVSGLVKGPEGYYIVKVFGFETSQPSQQISKPEANPREKARRDLLNKELDRKFEEWLRDLEARAFIQISL